MKSTAIIGVILILLGMAALAYPVGFINIGPIQAEPEPHYPIHSIIGLAAVVGGIVLVVAGSRK